MADIPHIVNMAELAWKDEHDSEHYTGWSKRLTPAMDHRQGHIGVVVERLKPKSLSCPHHYHVHEDEFCLILKGKARLRYGDTTVEVKEGDAISFPRGERVAHFALAFGHHPEAPHRFHALGSRGSFHGLIRPCHTLNLVGPLAYELLKPLVPKRPNRSRVCWVLFHFTQPTGRQAGFSTWA